MAEKLYKLSPDRDLQCYFYIPSAIAAMSEAGPNGFTLSGTWRQQFDWAVVEWNRDNVFEHPAIRSLPDGDLSGLSLSYRESRHRCIEIESDLYPTVDWHLLRIWATGDDGAEDIYQVSIKKYARPVQGEYVCASGIMEIAGSPKTGDRIGLAMPVSPIVPGHELSEQNHYYVVEAGDDLVSVARKLADVINTSSLDFRAQSTASALRIEWYGYGDRSGRTGSDGNRISLYGYNSAGASCYWRDSHIKLEGGAFPDVYEVEIDFASIEGTSYGTGLRSRIPTERVRKMRWTWAAELQDGTYDRSEFQVLLTDWIVTGDRREYNVAGPGSRRLEDDHQSVVYTGTWNKPEYGNYSGNTIRSTSSKNAAFSVAYSEPLNHSLYLGTRLLDGGGRIIVKIDNKPPQEFDLKLSGEEVLARISLGFVSAGAHTVSITNLNGLFFFDFLEIAYPTVDLPDFEPQQDLALATDWDTYHSQSLPAERTAWMIYKLGFRGRVNYYVGALWFYELFLPGHRYSYASVTIESTGIESAGYSELEVGIVGSSFAPSKIQHYNLPDDTPRSVALALANKINSGYTVVWAVAVDNHLTITMRGITPAAWVRNPEPPRFFLSVTAGTSTFSIVPALQDFAGGAPGEAYEDPDVESSLAPITFYWRTDLTSLPRINRAARDWSRAFFRSLRIYGMDCVAAFSTELKNGDPNLAAGLAQRRNDGSPVVVNTPALQTNFSPVSTNYWRQVYLDMALLQQEGGLIPYLQAGEVQWWYFPWNALDGPRKGMPFYDEYTVQTFRSRFGKDIGYIASHEVDPSDFPNEVTLLPSLIGDYTASIRSALLAAYPETRFEVLYPLDVNDSPFNLLINYPADDWVPANLSCLKTESFTYTYARNLDSSFRTIQISAAKGFSQDKRSHLIGIADKTSSWMKEVDMTRSQNLESIVLFAVDQFCLIGYEMPPFVRQNRSVKLG